MGVRRYATATWDDQLIEGERVPIRFALLFLYDNEQEAAADAERLSMQGPFPYIDERSWLVAWEATEAERQQIKERLRGLEGPLAWVQHHFPELPVPQEGRNRLEANCYRSLDEGLKAFGL